MIIDNQHAVQQGAANIAPKIKPLLQKIKEYALWIFRLIANTIKEIAFILATAVIYPILQTRFDPKECVDTRDRNKDIPIILVHGYLHNSSGWMMTRHLLNKAGYKNVFTVDLGSLPFGKSIDDDYAKVLEAKVNEVMAMSEIKQVRFIGHSMGGLVSSHYALRMKPDDIEVKDVITLSSPLQGTKMAHIGPGECAKQMRNNHPFNQTLSQEINRSDDIRFHHFGSDTDFIVGKQSALNGVTIEDEQENNLYHYNGGHASILFSPKVNRQILAILNDIER